MGATCCGEAGGEKITITVMTLNYCGIPSSPFDFYISDYEPQLAILGKIFEETCEEQLFGFKEDTKNKNFGAVQKNFKRGRYSPMFDRMAGVREVGNHYKEFKPMNGIDFKKEWDRAFEQQRQEIRKKCKNQSEEQFKKHVDYLKNYDFIAYKAFLKYVYHMSYEDILRDKSFTLEKYMRVFEPFFDFSFLSSENKLSKFRYGYRKTNPDVFFIQECGKELIDFLERKAKTNYFWFSDEEDDNLIIFKRNRKETKSFVGDTYESFKIVKLEDVVKDTTEYKKGDQSYRKIFAVESPNFFVIAMHLTSRQESNTGQKEYLNALLKELRDNQKYKSKTVIVGGDINSFHDKFEPGYKFYPQKEEDITTFKKRTALQTQKNKKDTRVKRSIDKIITNGVIKKGGITLIDGQEPDYYRDNEKSLKASPQEEKDNGKGMDSKVKMLLPCDVHPFDQFLVKTELEIPNYQVKEEVLGMFQGAV